jgi:hypothetical protein
MRPCGGAERSALRARCCGYLFFLLLLLGLASVQRASLCWCGALATAACPGGSSLPHQSLTSTLRSPDKPSTPNLDPFIYRAAVSACLPCLCCSVCCLQARSNTSGYLALCIHGRFRGGSLQQSACICQSRRNLRLHSPFASALNRNGPISSNHSCVSGGLLARDANQAVAVAASCATERSKPRAPQQKRVETFDTQSLPWCIFVVPSTPFECL